jgi:hypothetical protein
MNEYGFKKDKNGNPTIESCNQNFFGSYYSRVEVQTIFRAMYNNDSGIQDKFIAFWVHVAKRFARNKYVIGFDPLNEPEIAPNNFYNYVRHKFFGGKYGDKEEFAPFFSRIYKEALQTASKDSIMYFEANNWPDIEKV